ncbi:plasmid transfer protein TraA [Streptomyces sp. NPDC093595]|uniref:plasmid transfer protein TraA n=1 Tax=Streptomyces sp. NPDC093595 TaxID=3366045 RepID=UPI0038308442
MSTHTNDWMPRQGQGGQQRPPRGAGNGGRANAGTTYNFNFGPKDDAAKSGGAAGRGAQGGGAGQGSSGRRGGAYSPLADPEFFTNADVRNYCESARAAFLTLSFDLAMAAEILHAVLKEVPDPDGKPFGSKMRARRVTRRLAKAADDAKDAAKNAAATYAAFQREFSPEMEHNPRARQQQGRRPFDFNG